MPVVIMVNLTISLAVALVLRLEKEKATLAAEVADLQGIVDHASKNQVTKPS